MSQRHFLISYLEEAEKDSTKDYLLSITSENIYIRFFRDENNRELWKKKLATLEGLELRRSPLFEAIHSFGEWKIEKDYKKGVLSAEKFEESEKISYEKNWFWLLVHSLETTAYIYRTLGYKDKLALVSRKIVVYLKDEKVTLPTHTVLDLVHLFIGLMQSSERSDIDETYKIAVAYSERKLGKDPFHFQRSFLFEAIEIGRFLHLDSEVNKLQNTIIEKWIEESSVKGKSSNLIKFSLLQSALDYSVIVGNKEKTEEIKKALSATDFSNELKEVGLPEEQRKEFEEAARKHFEKVREKITKYVDGLSKLPPHQIILNICNDDSIIPMNVAKTEKFVQELMEKHPIQNIFGTILDTGRKTIRLETREDKEKYRLNEQLLFGLNETIWIVNQIWRELEDRNLISNSVISRFLPQCSQIDVNTLKLIEVGIYHHFKTEYVASISILVPLIENVMFNYLKSIGADISSYEGEVIEQRELGGLLNLKEVESGFGKDFQYFLKLFLVEGDSINFRNRLAHSNVSIEEFNDRISSIILFIILKIASKTFRPPE